MLFSDHISLSLCSIRNVLKCFIFIVCRVFSVKFSNDGSYIISGSDDTNLRLWKAKASEQLGVVRISSSDKIALIILLCCCNLLYALLLNIISELFAYVQLLPRERKNHEYMEAVKNRYKHLPEVKRIVRYIYIFFIYFQGSVKKLYVFFPVIEPDIKFQGVESLRYSALLHFTSQN